MRAPMAAPAQPLDPLAYPLIALAIASLGLSMRGVVVLAPLAIALALHPWWRRRRGQRAPLAGLAALAPHLACGAAVAVLASIWPVTDAGNDSQGGPFFVGYYALCLGLIKLYGRSDATTSARLVLCASAAHACAAPALRRFLGKTDAWGAGPLGGALPEPHTLYLVALSAHTVLVALLLSRAPRRQGNRSPAARALTVALFLLVALLAYGGERLLSRHYVAITRWIAELGGGLSPHTGGAGFSEHAELGSVSRRRGSSEELVALRAYASSPPGYLRGMVYLTYNDGGWAPDPAGPSRARTNDGLVTYEEGAGERAPTLSIYPAEVNKASFFLPLDTAAVHTPCGLVEKFPGRILRSLSQPTSRGYQVITSDAPLHDEGQVRGRYLQFPRNRGVRTAIDDLITRLRLKGLPADDASARLAAYFAREYRYELGITFRGKVDPVIQFLRDKRHGHCELFATVGVLTLRRLGHPARYVTGFVCRERNAVRRDLFLARNRHAHAWVEFYDPAPALGWSRAELTPPEGRPDTTPVGAQRAFSDWLASLGQQLFELLSDGIPGLPGRLLDALRELGRRLVRSPAAMMMIAAAVVLFWASRLVGRPRRRRTSRGWEPLALSEDLRALRERVEALQAHLRRHGLGRGWSEPLRAWARRLGALDAARLAAALPSGCAPDEALALIERFAGARYAPGAHPDASPPDRDSPL